MGLFNRNQGDSPTPSTLGEVKPPADSNNFDFDAISRDLDAQNGASSFDSLLAAPVSPEQRKLAAEEIPDFPENDPLGITTPQDTPLTTPVVMASSPEAVINAPINPPVNATTESTPPAPIAAKALNMSAGKKPLPLVPLLGALGVLAVAGGGAMFLLNSSGQETAPPVPVAPPPPRVAANPSQPTEPVKPNVPPVAGVPVMPPLRDSPLPPNTADAGVRSASPGIAPKPVPKRPIEKMKGSSSVSLTFGQPTSKAPSATADLDPALASKLKALWRAGAEAKHKKNYKAAREAWGEALRLRPGHPGFQDSINKLPR